MRSSMKPGAGALRDGALRELLLLLVSHEKVDVQPRRPVVDAHETG